MLTFYLEFQVAVAFSARFLSFPNCFTYKTSFAVIHDHICLVFPIKIFLTNKRFVKWVLTCYFRVMSLNQDLPYVKLRHTKLFDMIKNIVLWNTSVYNLSNICCLVPVLLFLPCIACWIGPNNSSLVFFSRKLSGSLIVRVLRFSNWQLFVTCRRQDMTSPKA